MRVTVGDSGLCCCIGVTYFERQSTRLCVDCARALWDSFCFRFVTSHSGEDQRAGGGWTLTKSWTIICGSRRDQEEGDGAGPSRESRRNQEQGDGAGLRKLYKSAVNLFKSGALYTFLFFIFFKPTSHLEYVSS